MPRPSQATKVQNAMIEKRQQIDVLIEQVRQQADQHFDRDPDDCHWGHVGDLSHLIEGLENTLGIERH